MGEKRIFISDVHLGAGRFGEESKDEGKYPHEWDRLSEEETKNFVNFLQYLQSDYGSKIKEVVLLGDIFDNWVFPHNLVPPTIEELITAEKNTKVVRELNKLARKTKIFYVPGNHDMHASREVIARYFPEFTYCPKRFSSGRLIAEHGHHYAMFNAPANFSGNINGLPLGYFISRIEATRKAMSNRDDRTYHTYVDDFIELVGKQTLPQSVFEAVIEEAELDENIKFKVKRKNGGIKKISANKVKSVYKNIYDDWPTHTVSRHRAVFAELDMLGPIADKLCKRDNYQVCIFGHSHKSEIDKDSWFVDDRIYANAGYWCGSKCTFVEVEKTGEGYRVSTVKWFGKQKKVKREESAKI